MKNLITPTQVLRLAFDSSELPSPDAIAAADIAAAEQRHIVPITGQQLYEALLSGSDTSFVEEYLAAPLALLTRVAVQPRLDIRTGACGTTAPRSSLFQPADAAARRERARGLRRQARTLLRRAAAHLATHAEQFPGYDPRQDILNRCSIDGSFVQTR